MGVGVRGERRGSGYLEVLSASHPVHKQYLSCNGIAILVLDHFDEIRELTKKLNS